MTASYHLNRLWQAVLGCNVASLGRLFLFGPLRFYRSCVVSYEAARDVSTNALARIPVVGLGEILGDRRPVIQCRAIPPEEGTLSTRELVALLSILVAESPSEVLEIGTFMGHTTRQLAENLPAGIVHTVDLPEDYSPERDLKSTLPKDDFHLIRQRVVGREFQGQPCASRIRQHFADTATWDFAEAGHPTFFFIDGSHTYEHCRSDSEKCFALCQGRGVFLWHDCGNGHPGVVRLLDEWRSQGREVKRIDGTPIVYWKGV
jgi:hypothetical protein